ncbi:hypothetical protein SAMN03159362_4526 [Pseudomonas sp. NFIX51]|uniref:hypothetical protein n=1 Tax=unclassified Pseudomonas TaxID=196821 RepID=UPI0008AF0588|nr:MULTISPECIES: hypothetical protein [unclassified Pseudomonas]SEM38758.1 hypothetical protein SAMN03159414_5082 [Pseudomonas sp. NFACC41-3]SMH58862.1 hypothetical protein SAMN03159362_4526 [Pseudomonas sp. NFIX51]
MSSNFERALARQEIPQFFRGQGEYLTRDGDWDEHLFCINWPGIFAYLRDNADGEQQLSAGFELYVYSIDKSKLYSAGTQTYRCYPWTLLVHPGALNGDTRARSFRSPLPRARRERRRILPQ